MFRAMPRLRGTARCLSWPPTENPLGCSQASKAAVVEATESLEIYPDGDSAALRAAISARYGLNADRIVCGAGSDEIFQLLARAFLQNGDNIIQSKHAFLVYRLVAPAIRRRGRVVQKKPPTLKADVDAMLSLVDEKTKIVFLANPNNPTGNYLPISEVRRLHAGLPKTVLLVLDAAYAEYVSRNDYEAGVELASQNENVLMTRTFSKIYGLASLRLGWAYGPAHVVDAINRVRGPFNVSAAAQAAGVAALQDAEFVEQSALMNTKGVARLTDTLRAMGLTVVDSVANFVLTQFQDAEQAKAAATYLEVERGVSVRAMAGYGLPDYLRISVGDDEGVEAVLDGLKAFFSK